MIRVTASRAVEFRNARPPGPAGHNHRHTGASRRQKRAAITKVGRDGGMGDAQIEPGGPPDLRLFYISGHRGAGSACSARRVRRRTTADRRVIHRPWNAQCTATWPQPRRGVVAGHCGGREPRPSRLRAWPRREAEVVCLAAARIPQVQRIRGQEPNHGVGRRQRYDDLSDALHAHSPRVCREHPGWGGARAAHGLSGWGCAGRCGSGRRQPRARQVGRP
jgi:hypothetical protein